MIESVKKGVEQAVEESIPALTTLLRNFAQSTGWPTDAVRTLRVQYENGEFEARSKDDRAADLEYGDGESVPSPAVRQFANRLEEAEKVLLRKAEDMLKGVL